jgi:hypothetical protein
MSDRNQDQLSDKEKIDRAAQHEEGRFYKKQMWAITTAGVVLLGALLTAVRDVNGERPVPLLDKFVAVAIIAAGVWLSWHYLESLHRGLKDVRLALNPNDWGAEDRGRDIVKLQKAILVGSAVVVVWAIYKLS